MYFGLCRTSTTILATVFVTKYQLGHSVVHGGTLSLWAVHSAILTNELIFWTRKALYAKSYVVHGRCKLTMAILLSSNAISNRLVQ